MATNPVPENYLDLASWCRATAKARRDGRSRTLDSIIDVCTEILRRNASAKPKPAAEKPAAAKPAAAKPKPAWPKAAAAAHAETPLAETPLANTSTKAKI